MLLSEPVCVPSLQPLVTHPVGVLPERHGGGCGVMQEPIHLIEEAVEAFSVIQRPELDRLQLVIWVIRGPEEAEQLIAVDRKQANAAPKGLKVRVQPCSVRLTKCLLRLLVLPEA